MRDQLGANCILLPSPPRSRPFPLPSTLHCTTDSTTRFWYSGNWEKSDMGRWTQYDEDDYRLPEGMKRVGYDSDSGRYYFRDSEGKMYEGPEGSEFGEMTRVSSAPIAIPEEGDDDLEAAPRGDGYSALATESGQAPRRGYSNAGAYRTIFPFFLLIAVVLLLIWRLVIHPTTITPPPPCPDKTTPYRVKSGDSCWEISRVHGFSLEQFRNTNPKVDCDKLMPGRRVCLPASKTA